MRYLLASMCALLFSTSISAQKSHENVALQTVFCETSAQMNMFLDLHVRQFMPGPRALLRVNEVARKSDACSFVVVRVAHVQKWQAVKIHSSTVLVFEARISHLLHPLGWVPLTRQVTWIGYAVRPGREV